MYYVSNANIEIVLSSDKMALNILVSRSCYFSKLLTHKPLKIQNRAYANMRQSSLDGLTGRGTSMFPSRPRPSSSETNLRKLAMGDQALRPGSALGLLQGNLIFSKINTKHDFGMLLDSLLD